MTIASHRIAIQGLTALRSHPMYFAAAPPMIRTTATTLRREKRRSVGPKNRPRLPPRQRLEESRRHECAKDDAAADP